MKDGEEENKKVIYKKCIEDNINRIKEIQDRRTRERRAFEERDRVYAEELKQTEREVEDLTDLLNNLELEESNEELRVGEWVVIEINTGGLRGKRGKILKVTPCQYRIKIPGIEIPVYRNKGSVRKL